MFLAKLKSLAHHLGSIALAGLALYGIVGVFTTAELAFGAPNPLAPLLNLVDDASVPLRINYQGRLRDPQGAPFNGAYDMTFRLYDDAFALPGAEIWSEAHSGVTVRDGHFSVLLGDATPFSATIFNSTDRYIGVTVGTNEEMLPLQRFASVPYAIYADRAFSLSAADGDPHDAVYVDAEGDVGIGTDQPETHLHLNASPSRPQLRLEDGNGFWQVWGGNNYSIHEGEDVASTSRFFIQGDTGNIGININSPDAKLHIEGPDNDGTTAGLKIESEGNDQIMLLDGNEIDTINATMSLNSNSGRPISIGRVAIPSKLDVHGNTTMNGNLTVNGDITNLGVSGQTSATSPDGGGSTIENLGDNSNRMCFLTKVGFEDLDNDGDPGFCEIHISSGQWRLKANIDGSNNNVAYCTARCLTW